MSSNQDFSFGDLTQTYRKFTMPSKVVFWVTVLLSTTAVMIETIGGLPLGSFIISLLIGVMTIAYLQFREPAAFKDGAGE